MQLLEKVIFFFDITEYWNLVMGKQIPSEYRLAFPLFIIMRRVG